MRNTSGIAAPLALINPRLACTTRVTVLIMYVCLSFGYYVFCHYGQWGNIPTGLCCNNKKPIFVKLQCSKVMARKPSKQANTQWICICIGLPGLQSARGRHQKQWRVSIESHNVYTCRVASQSKPQWTRGRLHQDKCCPANQLVSACEFRNAHVGVRCSLTGQTLTSSTERFALHCSFRVGYFPEWINCVDSNARPVDNKSTIPRTTLILKSVPGWDSSPSPSIY